MHHILGDPESDTPDWIIERLAAIRAAEAVPESGNSPSTNFVIPWESDARFAALEKIDYRSLSPSIVIQQVIEAVNLPVLVSKWGDAARRSSHLDSLLRHAIEYEEMTLEAGSAATLTGLILRLEQLARDKKDVRFPPLGHNAVTLTTYHSAKGLEWPVVILSGLDWDRDADMWSPVVRGGVPTEANPLANRTVQSWIWPFGKTEGEFPKLVAGSGLETDAITSPEGQEQAQRDQEESVRLLYVGCTRAKDKLVLAHRAGKYGWLSRLPSVDAILNPGLGDGEHPLTNIETSYVVRHLSATTADACRQPVHDHEVWFGTTDAMEPTATIERYHLPSEAPTPTSTISFRLENLPGQSYFPSGANEEQYAAIGDAVHCYFAALPSMRTLDATRKAAIARALPCGVFRERPGLPSCATFGGRSISGLGRCQVPWGRLAY